jgi:hypothetical protein
MKATLLAVGLLGVAVQARAQSSRSLNDPAVPRELVEALLSNPAARSPMIVVGEIPAPMVGKIYIPAGARVLGGTVSGSGAMTALAVPGRPDAVEAEFARELVKLGWTPFAQPSGNSSMTWGFADAPGQSMRSISAVGPAGYTPPLMYCGSNSTLTMSIDPSGPAESRVKLTTTGSSVCATMEAQRVEMIRMRAGEPVARMRPPVLTNPAGSRDMGSCPNLDRSGGGSARLNTPMTADELFAHYTRQLADSGWTPSPGTTVGREWTRSDSTGKHTVSLRVRSAPDAPNCRELEMEMRSARRPI